MQPKMTLTRATCYVAAMQELTLQETIEHDRLKDGLELARNGDAYYSYVAQSWICASASRPNKIYAVDLQHSLCTCRDHAERRTYCKHLIASWLTWRVNDILTHAETMHKSPTFIDWLFPTATTATATA